jgi:serine/threonine protein kinase/tetratricopeptide (TPR) repeat protein
LIGTTLGPYRLDRELGAGGMGKVYAAVVEGRAPGLDAGTRVALKIVHPHLLETPGFFMRFLREAEIGRSVVHENVVRTHMADALRHGGEDVHFLVMEYVEGQTLRELLDELDRVPEELCRHIGREVAKGLAAIHAAGVIHRDLKPENVLITADHHTVKVMDLGVARLAEETLRLSQSGAFVGSVEYAAPEQFGAKEVGAAADLHALGLVLYELATAQHPFRADDFRAVMRRVLDEKPRRPAEINPQLSPFFEELVLQLLEKDPARRIASAAELAQILDDGEKSTWWREKAKSIRTTTKRPLRRIRIPRETALYGRDAELARLRTLYDKAKSGDGQVLLVEGEAGIGKSRLLDEFVGLLQRDGEDLNFLWGSYPPGGAATSSGAFSTAYREYFGDAGLEDSVRERLGVAGILAPSYAALLLGTSAPAGAEPLTKDSLQTCFVHTTRSLATERTTVVLIDDLHFAPEEGRALFASLALAVQGHCILLVGTTRPGVDEKWLAQLTRVPQTTHLTVPRLGPKDLIRLLADSLHSDHAASEIGAQIALKSDGNPFFVFEILRGLREGKFLTQRPDGTWVTTRVIRDIQIPSSIADLVNARVADLDDAERNLLDVAACCGFEFDAGLVAAVLGVGRIPSLQMLAKVEKRHRLVRSAGDRFVFDHHQVQEALYAALSKPLREEYHAAVATALEAKSGTVSNEAKNLDGSLCVDLAEHFLKGAQGARALRYLDAALAHLERSYLNAQAVDLAELALAVPGLLAGAERARALLRLAEGPLGRLGLRTRHEDAAREAERLAAEVGDEALRGDATCALGAVYLLTSRYAQAESAFRSAIAIARACGNASAETAATGRLGDVLLDLGRCAEAQECYQRTFTLALVGGDRRSEAITILAMGKVHLMQGRPVEAGEHFLRARAIFRETGNREGEAFAMTNLGVVAISRGRYAEAQECHECALVLARAIGDRVHEGGATGNLGSVLWSIGRWDDARERMSQWLKIAQETGDRRRECIATLNLGTLSCSVGRLADAQHHLEQAVALAREIRTEPVETSAHHSLGIALLRLGQLGVAREHVERSLVLARGLGDRRQEGFAHEILAAIDVEEGDSAAAELKLAAALEVRRSIGHRDGEARVLCARGALRAREGRSDEARADLAAALALARELSLHDVELDVCAHLAAILDGDVPAALASFAAHEGHIEVRDVMGSRFLLWQATRDRTHLAEARRLLDFMVEHAPPECRESMLTNVRLHREIMAACTEQGM